MKESTSIKAMIFPAHRAVKRLFPPVSKPLRQSSIPFFSDFTKHFSFCVLLLCSGGVFCLYVTQFFRQNVKNRRVMCRWFFASKQISAFILIFALILIFIPVRFLLLAVTVVPAVVLTVVLAPGCVMLFPADNNACRHGDNYRAHRRGDGNDYYIVLLRIRIRRRRS